MALGIGGAALLAYAMPAAAIALVWPVLFAIPGAILVRRVAPDLPAPGQVGIAIVASVFLSAHAVHLVALIVGFGRPAIIVAAAVLGLAAVGITRIRHPWLPPWSPPTIAGMRAAIREDAAAWLIAGIVGSIVLVVLFTNGWRETQDGWVSGGWNWSDLLVHVAIGSSIAAGNFPPQVPYVAGEPLTYHWFADFHGAIAALVAGVELIPVYFATSAVFAGTLALLVWALAVRLTGDRRVAAIATVLACLGGGMGWLRLGADVLAGQTDIFGLIVANPYDNSWADGWPWFRIASVFGTGFLPHRATTLGLPGLLAVVLLVVHGWGRRPAVVLVAGVLAALLAPFQFYAFPATYLVVGLYVVASGRWRERTLIRDGFLFLAPVVLAMPFIASAILQQGEQGSFRFVLGWSEARFSEGPAAVLFFYVTNLGLPFLLATAAALTARHLSGRGFLAAWMVALFLLPNLVVVSAVEFDMNKYFQMMWIPVAILAAWFVRRWPGPAIAAVIAISATSPALIAAWHMTNPAVTMSLAQERAAQWIAANTPERSVFVTDDFINNPVDLAGRLRITSFGPYVANLGYDPAPREADIRAAYCDGPDVAAEVMASYGATFVLSSGGVLDCDDGQPTDFAASPRFETVYDKEGVTVWRLSPLARRRP